MINGVGDSQLRMNIFRSRCREVWGGRGVWCSKGLGQGYLGVGGSGLTVKLDLGWEIVEEWNFAKIGGTVMNP